MTRENLADSIPDDKPLWQLTAGEFRALLLSTAAGGGVDDDAPRPAKAICALIPGTSEGYIRGHVAAEGRGARQCRLYRPSAVRAALAACPPMPPCKTGAAAVDADPILAMLASGELIAKRGAR